MRVRVFIPLITLILTLMSCENKNSNTKTDKQSTTAAVAVTGSWESMYDRIDAAELPDNIHGIAKTNKIVFGVEDNANINVNDVFLKKSACLWNNVQNVNDILSQAKSIMFLGYSLGKTDHHYFKEFFQAAVFNKINDKNIRMSYYKEDGMYEVLKQIDELTSNSLQKLRLHQNFKMFDLAK